MNQDIRIAVSFKGHRKRKKLCRLLGFGSEIYLIDLWLTVAMDCPEGVLTGWDEEDIADACNWTGDPKELVDAFIESNWLEKNSDGEYQLHDWCEHQGWACKARVRSDAAKKAADARWIKKREAKEKPFNAGANAPAMRPHSEGNADRNAPSPSPSPYPSPTLYKKMAGEIYDLYLEKIAPEKKSKQRALKNIEKWLKKERSKSDLIQAVKNYSLGCSSNPTYRKDPANFFGINEDFAFDYLPDNFTPPQELSLAQKAF